MLRWLAPLLLLCAAVQPAARAADLPGPWVQLTADAGVEIRSVVQPGMPCPRVVADGASLQARVRSESDADGAYPVTVCAARTTMAARRATVDGLRVAMLPGAIRRVVVIGDTGCRLKGSYVQDCNDPARWPFATIARLAAARHPDLVIHVGDYHYRETPCPAGRPGCAASPFGDTWAVWRKDFFDPAAPLLAAAPWVMVRGNHELCNRGGKGWFRLLDAHPDTNCVAMTPPYSLRVDILNLLVLDSADADDTVAEPAKVASFRSQLQSLLTDARPHSWLLTHRPVWAFAQGEGVSPGATLNTTEQAAIRDLIPAGLDMVVSGHVHDFTSYDFGPARPAQFVVGNGGDANDPIVQPLAPGLTIDGMSIRRVFATPEYGYVVLHRLAEGWSAVVYSVTDDVLARCRLRGRDVRCRAAPG